MYVELKRTHIIKLIIQGASVCVCVSGCLLYITIKIN